MLKILSPSACLLTIMPSRWITFNSVYHNFLGSWTSPRKMFLCFSPLTDHIREAKPDKADVVGHVICNQVEGPLLSEPACRQIDQRIITHSFSRRSSDCGKPLPDFYQSTRVLGWLFVLVPWIPPELLWTLLRGMLFMRIIIGSCLGSELFYGSSDSQRDSLLL